MPCAGGGGYLTFVVEDADSFCIGNNEGYQTGDKKMNPTKSKYYRHFKGGIYKLLGFAKDSETLEDLVVYQALYGEGQIWVRPKDMFFETVTRDGRTFSRFEEMPENEVDGLPE